MNRKVTIVLLGVGCVLFFLVYVCYRHRISVDDVVLEAYGKPSHEGISLDKFSFALNRHGPVTENPELWFRLIEDTDAKVSEDMRRLYAFALIQRHGSHGLSGKAFSLLLGNHVWVDFSTVVSLGAMAGSLPIHWDRSEAVFTVEVLKKNSGHLRLTLFMVSSQHVDVDVIQGLARGEIAVMEKHKNMRIRLTPMLVDVRSGDALLGNRFVKGDYLGRTIW
jgi:hypothetical protein